jgi:hypothetical protein
MGFVKCYLGSCKEPHHGPKRETMKWWWIVPALIYPWRWKNYGEEYSGFRLWFYTKRGTYHIDFWRCVN